MTVIRKPPPTTPRPSPVFITVPEDALRAELDKLIAKRNELASLLVEALPNLSDYAIMVAGEPGSLWSRIHRAITDLKAGQ